VSPKFQIVIPRSVRERLGIRAGQRLAVILVDERIMLLPERPIWKARRPLRGMNTSGYRG
jgi:AbrB family looped-hinge helix DNA binding protein